MIGWLDEDLKRELVAAIEIVPDLVQTETDRIKFLRAEGFDTIKATRRLALYWKHRKTVFGDRWLLPMTQTGTGALTKKEIEIVQSGYMALISPSPVCIIDSSRLTKPPLEDELAACMFYFGTISSNEQTQTAGATLLHVVTGRGHQNLSTDQDCWTIIHRS